MASVAVNETFEAVEGKFHSAVRHFWRSKGGDLDDWTDVAHGLYMHAVATYDPDKGGDFGDWVWHKVYCGLLDQWRKQCVRHRALPRCDVELDGLRPSKPWRNGLSDQAREVVDLVLNKEVRAGRKASRFAWQAAIMDVLTEAGWTVAQVAEAFAEIQEAMS